MGNKRTLKLVLEYDGTNFSGWQVQPDKRTVQMVVEDALAKILRQPVRLTAAGRTDAGVHAEGQVAGFQAESEMECWRLKRAMNGILPDDVTVLDITDTRPEFNARYDARSRTYRYTLSDQRLSLGRSYVWHIKYKLSRELLEKSTQPLDGNCSLRGFSKGDDNDDFSTIFLKNSWTFHDNLMIFEICAVRFFHHSVRSIVGSTVEVARGKESPDLLQRILDTQDRSLAGPTAPASGLCLVKVDYGDEP
ncbi:tRNA pseudouridine(38-40) synthase TruA [Candidatus Latescibacterota bacterium]